MHNQMENTTMTIMSFSIHCNLMLIIDKPHTKHRNINCGLLTLGTCHICSVLTECGKEVGLMKGANEITAVNVFSSDMIYNCFNQIFAINQFENVHHK